MIQDWFWVRHGPTHAKGMVGWTDLAADLSDTGAVDRLADHVPREAVVVSSDLSRAAATADAIQRQRVRLAHAPALREMHFGDWEMRHHAEIEAEDRDRIFAFWDQPGDVAPPGGESWNALRARVDGWVDAFEGSGPVIAVAHFGVILTQVQRALSIPAREAFSHRIDNLSVTHLQRSAEGWQVALLNHLP